MHHTTVSTTRPHSATARALTCLAATVATVGALGLASASAASAAPLPWDMERAGLPWVPSTSVDGEITVAPVKVDDPKTGVLRTFKRDGSPVTYATTWAGVDSRWAPGGDKLLTTATQGFDTTAIGPNAPEYVYSQRYGTSHNWSPYGESSTGASTVIGNTPYTSRAYWQVRNTTQVLSPATASDPGAGAPLPSGDGYVVDIAGGGTGARDLGMVEASFPVWANPSLNAPSSAPTALGYSALDAHDAAVSNDGTLAFVGTSADGPAIFVDEGTGPVAVAPLTTACAGQRPAFAPSGRSIAYVAPVAGDCTSTELRVLAKSGNTFVGGTDTKVTDSKTGAPAGMTFANPSWRPRTPAAEKVRLGGKDRVATAVAVSRYGWPDGSQCAILASSTAFPDALVGGPLAGAMGAPLLTTPTKTLDSRVLAELKRLMPATRDRFVYIVGGTGAVSSSVQKTLESNGFGVVRLGASDRFGTSVAVAKELDAGYTDFPLPRNTVFLANGMTFPDALSAGPAATGYFAPVLLSNGTKVPAVVNSYVSGRSQIRKVNAVGGSAATAMRSFGAKAGVAATGADRYETSAVVAQTWFPDGAVVGYASGENFPDAVTGGAFMSNWYGPLMLVRSATVPSPVGSTALAYRASTDQTVTFGGTGVISTTVQNTVASRAGTQTAVWGPTTPVVDNPVYPVPPAAKGMARPDRPGTPDQRGSRLRPDTQDFRSANQR